MCLVKLSVRKVLEHFREANSIILPVNVGSLRTPSQLLYQLTCRRVKNSNESPLWKYKWKTEQLQNTSRDDRFRHPKLLSRSVWLTFSDAVAIRVPCKFREMQHSDPSWAKMSTGGFSVLAKSTIWTWPEWVPGKANRELLLLGHSTQRPRKNKKGNWFKSHTSIMTFSHLFLMQTDPLGCSKSRTRAADGGCGWRWRL